MMDNGLLKVIANKGQFIMTSTNNKVLSEDKYNLWYMEFKYPSEHSIKGRKFEFELQMIFNKSVDSQKGPVAVSVFFDRTLATHKDPGLPFFHVLDLKNQKTEKFKKVEWYIDFLLAELQ